MADIRDILDLEQAVAEVSRESIINGDKMKKKPTASKSVKRPDGMNREVFALMCNDKKELPSLIPTNTGKEYKQTKAKLSMRKARKWEWAPFTNPARKDNAVFRHWKRTTDEPREYPFAQFNKQVELPKYTETEYDQHLRSSDWSQQETDHLMDLCQRFDLRFIIIHDRWDRTLYKERSVEDLKERYYNISAILTELKTNPWSAMITSPTGEERVYQYDADHERKRKEQLERLFDRTQEQINEEQTLLAEMKKIETRKRERERKTQDLQKLISRTDKQIESIMEEANEIKAPVASTSRSRTDKKASKKKTTQHRSAKIDTITAELSGLSFPEVRGPGVNLRSVRMKLPTGLGQKKTKAIESDLKRLDIDLHPPSTDDICTAFNELRSDIALSIDIKSMLASYEYEIQSLKHQSEALKAKLKDAAVPSTSGATTSKSVSQCDIIDVEGSPGTSD